MIRYVQPTPAPVILVTLCSVLAWDRMPAHNKADRPRVLVVPEKPGSSAKKGTTKLENVVSFCLPLARPSVGATETGHYPQGASDRFCRRNDSRGSDTVKPRLSGDPQADRAALFVGGALDKVPSEILAADTASSSASILPRASRPSCSLPWRRSKAQAIRVARTYWRWRLTWNLSGCTSPRRAPLAYIR